MLLDGATIDKEVVHVDDDTVIKKISEHVIHSRLEGCRCIAQPKGHDHELKVAIFSAKCCLVNILVYNSYEVEARL